MPKLLALCGLLTLLLAACAQPDAANKSPSSGSLAGPAGSEIARPNPRQAGVIGR